MAYLGKCFNEIGDSLEGEFHRVGYDARHGFGEYVVLRRDDGKLVQVFLKARLRPLLTATLKENNIRPLRLKITFTGFDAGRGKPKKFRLETI